MSASDLPSSRENFPVVLPCTCLLSIICYWKNINDCCRNLKTNCDVHLGTSRVFSMPPGFSYSLPQEENECKESHGTKQLRNC